MVDVKSTNVNETPCVNSGRQVYQCQRDTLCEWWTSSLLMSTRHPVLKVYVKSNNVNETPCAMVDVQSTNVNKTPVRWWTSSIQMSTRHPVRMVDVKSTNVNETPCANGVRQVYQCQRDTLCVGCV